MTVLTHGHLSMTELCNILRKYHSPRNIMRYTKELVNSGKIEHGRIAKQGKRKRYFVREENTKDNLLQRTVQFKSKDDWKAFRTPVTQRQLSANISWEMQFYRKNEMEEWKRFTKSSQKTKDMIYYVSYHIALIVSCLRWISQLTWAIKSGMLGNSQSKLDLAYRNKERYEEFLEKIVYNLNSRDSKLMKTVSTAIYYEIMDSLDIKSTTLGKEKGKLIFQISKEYKLKTKL